MYGRKEILNKAELLEKLNIESHNLAEWMRYRDFPYLEHGSEVFFVAEDVERWISSQNHRQLDSASDAIPTEVLVVQLLEAADLDSFMQIYQRRLTRTVFHEYISGLAKKMGLSRARIIEDANLSETYGYQLFKGTRSPSRDTVISLAFGFGADLELTQRLLKTANEFELYPKIPREAVIMYCISHSLDLVCTQEKLKSLSMPLIGGNRIE